LQCGMRCGTERRSAPGASAVVAATIELRFGIKGKAHGQEGTVRRYPLDFRGNRAEGDDLLGDAYEYLMRHFATESGKSKGQFYTPAEVSRMMAKVIGAGSATRADQTIYDPTCGSGTRQGTDGRFAF